jgi:chromosome partition protein MukF
MVNSSSFADIVQPILTEERHLVLRSRDIALLVTIQHEIEQSPDGLLTIPYSAIQGLSSRIDLLDVKDSQKAELRVSESMTRLLTAGCLTKADISRLRLSGDAQYQLTSLGESVAEWHVIQSRFSGEPLTAIFKAFINQLTRIVEDAEKAVTPDDWHWDVVSQMQHALRDMLVSIHRHQNALDRRHAEMREFIPTLLTASSEESINQCEEQLSLVIETIEDLQEAVLSSTSTAFSLIDRIAELAKPHAPKGFDTVYDDLIRRLQSTSAWITQRAIDWMDHHSVVHTFLRTIIRVDRQRRVTDALKRSIAEPPEWSLEVADESSFYRMRADIVRAGPSKPPPRTAKKKDGYKREFEEVPPDAIPDLLVQYLMADLCNGEACASNLFEVTLPSMSNELRVAAYFPWLIGQMVRVGKLDPNTRDWKRITPTIEIEELRVTK